MSDNKAVRRWVRDVSDNKYRTPRDAIFAGIDLGVHKDAIMIIVGMFYRLTTPATDE